MSTTILAVTGRMVELSVISNNSGLPNTLLDAFFTCFLSLSLSLSFPFAAFADQIH